MQASVLTQEHKFCRMPFMHLLQKRLSLRVLAPHRERIRKLYKWSILLSAELTFCVQVCVALPLHYAFFAVMRILEPLYISPTVKCSKPYLQIIRGFQGFFSQQLNLRRKFNRRKASLFVNTKTDSMCTSIKKQPLYTRYKFAESQTWPFCQIKPFLQ